MTGHDEDPRQPGDDAGRHQDAQRDVRGDNDANPQGPRPRPASQNATTRRPLPKLIWFLGIHTGIGVAMGVIFASLLVQFNVSGLRDLLLISDSPYLPMFMLYWMMALTFAMFNVAAAVFLLPFDRSKD